MIWAPFTTTTSQTVHVGQKLHCLITLSPTRFTVAEVRPEAYSVYTSTTTELLYLDKLGVASARASRLGADTRRQPRSGNGVKTRKLAL